MHTSVSYLWVVSNTMSQRFNGYCKLKINSDNSDWRCKVVFSFQCRLVWMLSILLNTKVNMMACMSSYYVTVVIQHVTVFHHLLLDRRQRLFYWVFVCEMSSWKVTISLLMFAWLVQLVSLVTWLYRASLLFLRRLQCRNYYCFQTILHCNVTILGF